MSERFNYQFDEEYYRHCGTAHIVMAGCFDPPTQAHIDTMLDAMRSVRELTGKAVKGTFFPLPQRYVRIEAASKREGACAMLTMKARDGIYGINMGCPMLDVDYSAMPGRKPVSQAFQAMRNKKDMALVYFMVEWSPQLMDPGIRDMAKQCEAVILHTPSQADKYSSGLETKMLWQPCRHDLGRQSRRARIAMQNRNWDKLLELCGPSLYHSVKTEYLKDEAVRRPRKVTEDALSALGSALLSASPKKLSKYLGIDVSKIDAFEAAARIDRKLRSLDDVQVFRDAEKFLGKAAMIKNGWYNPWHNGIYIGRD